MARYVFDIETDGFLEDLTRIHSLVLKDVDTEKVYSYTNDDPDYPSIVEGIERLTNSDIMIGFNSIKFDIPALRKVYPLEFSLLRDVFTPKHMDLLICSRLIWTDMIDIDIRMRELPKECQGRHSLKSWGYRVGTLKGDYQDTNTFDEWSLHMQKYCERDVEITYKLWKTVQDEDYSERAIDLEHRFAELIDKQIENGFGFDVERAAKLYAALLERREELREYLIHEVPERIVQLKRPEYYQTEDGSKYATIADARKDGHKREAITAGPPRVKKIPFNPTSRQQVAALLIKDFGWKPEEFTDDGHPKVDETILSALPYPPAEAISELFLIEKRIGQLAEGDQAWLRLVRNGRLHGGCNTNGAVSGRVTHHRPNLATVPRVGNPFGEECRSLFIPSRGNVLCGFDASSLELRCAAHYLYPYDAGAYVKEVSEGDPHTANQKAAGLATRDQSKMFIYALIYGAGFQKLGSIVDPKANEKDQIKIGKRLKSKFLSAVPAFDKLISAIKAKYNTVGHLKGLDGRELRIRSEHSATNLLFQSAGALIMKQTLINFEALAREDGLTHQHEYWLVVNVHDEFQWECQPDMAASLGKLAIKAIELAGQDFRFRCPLTGEYKIGTNWSETH